MNAPTVTSDPNLRFEFFKLGTQYYVAARFAAVSHVLPVVGNLFHHAVEMYLKGCLCDHVSEKERRKLGHDLPALFNAVKSKHPSLSHFDTSIAALSPWEELRYPENARGVSLSIGPAAMVCTSLGQGREFVLTIAELDALVVELHRAGSVNPLALFIGSDGEEILTRNNHLADRWTFRSEVKKS